GRDAQRSNIMAAKVLAETVRSTIGPRGMDKMIVGSIGDIVITNDGATIMKEMDVQNPAAKMLVEVAKTQDSEVGDGTTTAVVLAVLGLSDLNEHLGCRILNVHFLHDGCTVIRYDDVSYAADHHLVHPAWAYCRTDGFRQDFGGHNVASLSVSSSRSLGSFSQDYDGYLLRHFRSDSEWEEV